MCGAVGLLAVHCAQFRGAKRVILIDNAKYRLEYASQKLPGVETLDFGEHDTVKRLKELVPNGPDVCIEAVGFHYAKSLMSKVEMAVGLQTDPADIINELIVSCRKVTCDPLAIGHFSPSLPWSNLMNGRMHGLCFVDCARARVCVWRGGGGG